MFLLTFYTLLFCSPAFISSLLPPSWEEPPPPPCLQTGRRRIRLPSEALWRGGSGGGEGGGKEGDQISRFQRLSSVCLSPSSLHLFLPPGSLETEWLSREEKHAPLAPLTPPPRPSIRPTSSLQINKGSKREESNTEGRFFTCSTLHMFSTQQFSPSGFDLEGDQDQDLVKTSPAPCPSALAAFVVLSSEQQMLEGQRPRGLYEN